MQLVGSRLQAHVDYGAGRAPVFRREAVGHDLEFLDGVHVRLDRLALAPLVGDLRVVVVHAVEQVVVLGGAHAASRKTAGARAGRGFVRPGRKQRQLDVVAPVQRKVHHFLVVDHLTLRRFVHRQQRGRRGHRHVLVHLAHFERQVHHRGLLDLEHDALAHHALEAGRFRGHAIAADAQRHGLIAAVRARGGLGGDVGFEVGDGDGGGRNERSGLVLHGADDARCLHLRGEQRAEQERKQ